MVVLKNAGCILRNERLRLNNKGRRPQGWRGSANHGLGWFFDSRRVGVTLHHRLLGRIVVVPLVGHRQRFGGPTRVTVSHQAWSLSHFFMVFLPVSIDISWYSQLPIGNPQAINRAVF